MRILFATILLLAFPSIAQWQKIDDVDYVWGPFSIYNLSLFSETGKYIEGTRPVMLTLTYHKPVDGRDFAISLARSWSNLGITLPEQDERIDKLRKIMPNIKKGDKLSYIALADRGYFILNNQVINEIFDHYFNDATLSVWLDPRVEIGRALLSHNQKVVTRAKSAVLPSNHQTIESYSAENIHKEGDPQPVAPSNTPHPKEKVPIVIPPTEQDDGDTIETLPIYDPLPKQIGNDDSFAKI